MAEKITQQQDQMARQLARARALLTGPAASPVLALHAGRKRKQETEGWRRGLLLKPLRRIIADRQRRQLPPLGQTRLAKLLSLEMKKLSADLRSSGAITRKTTDKYGVRAWLKRGISRRVVRKLQDELSAGPQEK